MRIGSCIQADAAKCGGWPCIRGTRIRVSDVLEMLASGMTKDEILADYPTLEREDFAAALRYAAHVVSHPVLLPVREADGGPAP